MVVESVRLSRAAVCSVKMEEELAAQRDAAIAVTKELQKQLQEIRGKVEAVAERRALTAERLRLHAEEEVRRVNEEREWEASVCNRLLYLSLFGGLIGAIVGWMLGLLVYLAFMQPLISFLLILPAMTFGGLCGLVVAKTKVQLENRRRDAKRNKVARHAEVEMAVNSAMDGAPLDPLESLPGVTSEELRSMHSAVNGSAEPDAQPSPTAASSSTASWTWYLASQTWQTSKDIASGVYSSGIFSHEVPSQDKKRQ